MWTVQSTGSGPRYAIDPVAFFAALIGGPLIVTAMSFWMLVPIAALAIGGPVYLILGTPILLCHLRFHPGTSDNITNLALKTVGIVTAIAALAIVGAALMDPLRQWLDEVGSALYILAFFAVFSAFFAVLWSWGFYWIYNCLRSDLSREPH